MVKKWFYIFPIALVLVGVAILMGAFSGKPSSKKGVADWEAQYQRAFLHTFPDGVDEIKFPVGPTRLEGVNLPLDATAYKIDATVWRQMVTWDGKLGPVLKKGEQAYMPISRNQNISQATFWVRGEGEATVSIERGQK